MDIKRLRQKLLKRELLRRSNEIQKELSGFYSDESAVITLKTLRSLKAKVWYYSDDLKVRYRIVDINDNEVVFITEMEEDSAFGVHEHDCVERGIVIEGHLIDDTNNLKLKEQEEWVYFPNQEHTPYARIKSIYQVTFSEQ